MSKGINKVILVGNVGADPDVRYTQAGSAVATLSIATKERWRDKESGELQERTEWHRVVFFNRLGEIVAEYVGKGSKIYVEGSLRTRKWQDTNTGQDRYTTEIVANEMQMLDKRDNLPMGPAPSSAVGPEPHEMLARKAPAATPASVAAPDFNDDDIPF